MPCLPMPLPSVTPVLIALHSSGAGGRQWDAWRRQPPHGATWHTPDLLGYTAEPWPLGVPISLQAEADAIAPLLRSAPHGVHLIGHSYGGSVALQLALRWPQHVRSLTLYEPVRFALLRDGEAGDQRLFDDIIAIGREMRVRVLQGRCREAAARFVDYWSGAGSWAALPPSRQDAIVVRTPKLPAEFEALFGDPLRLSGVRHLDLPVRLLCGTGSPLPALRVTELLAQTLPNATLERLDGLGHLGPIEAPQRVAARMAVHDTSSGMRLAA